MEAPIVLKPSWRHFKRSALRDYSGTAAMLAVLTVMANMAVLSHSRGGLTQTTVMVVAGVVVILVLFGAYKIAKLRAQIEITDAEIKMVGPITTRAIPRARISGLVFRDVNGLLPHVMRLAIVHDNQGQVVVTLDRCYWSDHSLRKLEDALGLPVGITPEVRSFREFRREWRKGSRLRSAASPTDSRSP